MQHAHVRWSFSQEQGDREEQEDAIRIASIPEKPEWGILSILSDGMGGMDNGHMFSMIATQGMASCFEKYKFSAELSMTQILYQCYCAAQDIALKSQPASEKEEGGATVTAVYIRKNRCAFLSVGDSRIYLLRGGALIQLNREQKLGVRLDERAALGFISWKQAKNNTERSAIMANLGRRSPIPPDICDRDFPLVPGDRLIQVSDGVCGTLSDRELESCIAGEWEGAAQRVMKSVLQHQKRHQDNASIVVLEIEPRHAALS